MRCGLLTVLEPLRDSWKIVNRISVPVPVPARARRALTAPRGQRTVSAWGPYTYHAPISVRLLSGCRRSQPCASWRNIAFCKANTDCGRSSGSRQAPVDHFSTLSGLARPDFLGGHEVVFLLAGIGLRRSAARQANMLAPTPYTSVHGPAVRLPVLSVRRSRACTWARAWDAWSSGSGARRRSRATPGCRRCADRCSRA
jgi:hypothetical protein